MLYLHSSGSCSVGPTSLLSLSIIWLYLNDREVGLGRRVAAPVPPCCLPTRRASCVLQPSDNTTMSSSSVSPPEALLSESITGRRVVRVRLGLISSLSWSDSLSELGAEVVTEGEPISETLLCSDEAMSVVVCRSVCLLPVTVTLSPSVTAHMEV